MSSEGTTCSICLESFRNPRELPCHHSFCESCLQEFIDKLANDGNTVTSFDCPNCRKKTSPPVGGKPPAEWAHQFSRFPKLDEAKEQTSSIPTIISRKCNSCEYDRKQVDASRYCTACREYICEECYTFHKRVSATRNHEVIRATDVGKVTTTFTKERCPCLSNKALKHYCKGHDEFCCSLCKRKKHENCKQVRQILDMSEDIRFYGELENMLKNMDKIRDHFQEIVTRTKDNQSSLEAEKKNAIVAIQRISTDLKAHLDVIEVSMTEEVNQLYQQATSRLAEHANKSQAAMKEVEASTSMLKFAEKEDKNDQIFVSYNRSRKEMVYFEKALKEIASATCKVKLIFQPDQEIKDMKLKLKTFGTVEIPQHKVVLPIFCPNKSLIERKAKEMKSTLYLYDNDALITGVVVLPNERFVTVNNTDGKVEMFDSSLNCISSCKVSGAWGIALTGINEVAVSAGAQKKIVVLSTEQSLINVRTLNTDRGCYGLAYCRKTRELVIKTLKPSSLQILTLTGDVVKTIEKDNKGQQLLNDRWCDTVAMNDTGDMLYVTDNTKGVIGVDRDGNVKFIYSDVKGPCGIGIDGEGNVYVCGSVSNDVHQLLPDGTKARVLLTAADVVKKPLALFYNRRNDTILLSIPLNANPLSLLPRPYRVIMFFQMV